MAIVTFPPFSSLLFRLSSRPLKTAPILHPFLPFQIDRQGALEVGFLALGVHQRPDQEGDNDDLGQRDYRDRQWQNRLSAKDQHQFDSYYSRW